MNTGPGGGPRGVPALRTSATKTDRMPRSWPKERAALMVLHGCRLYFRSNPTTLAKKLLWRLCARHINWRGIEVTSTTSFGARLRCLSTDILQAYILYFGVWEPNLTAFLQRRLQPGDVFVDVGANIGYFSLLASRRVSPHGSVVAIEASPSIYRALLGALGLNGVDNVRAVNVAAGRESALVDVYLANNQNLGATSTMRSRGRALEARVRSEPLATILRKDELSRARIVKIDVEGAEVDVLQGILSDMSAFPQNTEFVVEMSPAAIRAQGASPEELLQQFSAYGYHPYELVNDYSPEAYFRRSDVPPRRLRHTVDDQTDIVLSRVDAESL